MLRCRRTRTADPAGRGCIEGWRECKGAAAFLRYLHSPAVTQQLQRGGLTPVHELNP